MKNREALAKLLDQIAQAQQRVDAAQQNLKADRESLRAQKGSLATSEAKTTWREGLSWESSQLIARRDQLSEQVRQGKTILGKDSPEQKLRELQSRLAQEQERETQLRRFTEQVECLEQARERARAVQKVIRLKDEIQRVQDAIRAIERVDPKLMQMYQAFVQTQAQLADRQKQRDAVAGKTRWLCEKLSAGKPERWAELALEDPRKLSAAIGRAKNRVSVEMQNERDEEMRFEKRAATREEKLKSTREEIARLQAQDSIFELSFQNEMSEIADWSAALDRCRCAVPDCSQCSAPDPSLDQALDKFLKNIAAKRAALEWFGSGALPSSPVN